MGGIGSMEKWKCEDWKLNNLIVSPFSIYIESKRGFYSLSLLVCKN